MGTRDNDRRAKLLPQDHTKALGAVSSAVLNGAIGLAEIVLVTGYSAEMLTRLFDQPRYDQDGVLLVCCMAAAFDKVNMSRVLDLMGGGTSGTAIDQAARNVMCGGSAVLNDLRNLLHACRLCDMVTHNTVLTNQDVQSILRGFEAKSDYRFKSYWELVLDMDSERTSRLLSLLGIATLGTSFLHAIKSSAMPEESDGLVKVLKKLRSY